MERLAADGWAAGATGVGIGLITLMVTWVVGERLTALVLRPPAGPTVAMVSAVALGVVVAVVSGRRLLHMRR
jgi:hypothetical protein